MNTEADSAGTADEEKERKVAKGGRIPGSWFVIVLALAALILAGLAFWSVQKSLRAAAAGQAQLAGLEVKLDGNHKALETFKNRYGEIENRITEINRQQEKLNDSIAILYKNQARENLDWALAEVEHLIIIATHSLTLEHNVTTALAALQAADDRLRDLGDPGLVKVRKQLAEDMNALRSVKTVDITGLSLFLADLVNRVESLPLKNQPEPKQPDSQADKSTPEKQPAFKRLMIEIWQELKSLVVITRTGSASGALLLPDEKYFLYQNLRLQLESARTAALRRDTASFHASVEIVIGWIEEYFNGSDAGVGNILEALHKMLDQELDPKLPDVSSSLETLRAFIKDRSGSVPSDEGEPVS